jgi:hypothetical protein
MDCPKEPLTLSQVDDLRLAASKVSGATRRGFQAQMVLKYCDSNARTAERMFGVIAVRTLTCKSPRFSSVLVSNRDHEGCWRNIA